VVGDGDQPLRSTCAGLIKEPSVRRIDLGETPDVPADGTRSAIGRSIRRSAGGLVAHHP
jgi:hypothetical protein